MSLKFKFLLVLSLIYSVHSVTVNIEDGQVEGTKMTSRLGVSYDAFLGIPFAEPPVNELRFQPPQPVKPWTGVFDATAYGPFCMQGSLGGGSSNDRDISEDCLQLNVFSKNVGNSQLKPTIVFIHGGAWEIGSGVDSNPVMMMDRDVVFVTINYRLGAFGFLSTGTKDAYGNMALKDQTLALKWVKKNIEKFGGDSSRITIAGFSAGAHSVTAQVVSPMAKDLFHGAISMSGGIAWKSKIPGDYLGTAKKLAGKLSCGVDDVAAMVECLQKVRELIKQED
jgi:carboxylesterase type B